MTSIHLLKASLPLIERKKLSLDLGLIAYADIHRTILKLSPLPTPSPKKGRVYPALCLCIGHIRHRNKRLIHVLAIPDKEADGWGSPGCQGIWSYDTHS